MRRDVLPLLLLVGAVLAFLLATIGYPAPRLVPAGLALWALADLIE
jgi:hypothetical protein